MVNSTIEFWRGKKVLVTGHTCFKGSWLTLWLHQMGAKVIGISLPPINHPNLFSLVNIGAEIDSIYLDIRQAKNIESIVKKRSRKSSFTLRHKPLLGKVIDNL